MPWSWLRRCCLWLGLWCAWPALWAEALVLTPAEQAFVAAHPVIRVANDKHYAPFDFFDHGRPQGYSVDLVRLVLTRLGFEVEFVSSDDWADTIRQLQAGRLDVLTSIQHTDADARYLHYSQPYLRAREVVLVRQGEETIRSAYDLNDRVVAMPAGYDYLNVLRQHGVSFQHLVVPTMQDAVEAVARGKADATLEAEMVLQHIITRRGYTDLKMVYRLFGAEFENFYSTHFGVRQGLEPLRDLIDKSLAALTLEERNRLYLQWFGRAMGTGVEQDQVTWRLSPAERDYVARHPRLSVCLSEDWAPYAWREGGERARGVVLDYLTLMGQRAGIELVPEWVGAGQSVRQALASGACELAALPTDTWATPRGPVLRWSPTFLQLPYVLATNSDQLYVNDLSEVADQLFAVQRSGLLGAELRQAHPGIRLHEVGTTSEGLELVRLGRVFAHIDTPLAIAQAIQQGMPGNIKVVGKTPFGLSVALAVPPEQTALQGVIDKTTDTLSDGDHRAIHSRWMALQSEVGVDYALVWGVVAVAGTVLVISLLWNRSLKAAHARTQAALQQLTLAQERLQAANQQLEQMAATDRLTGVNNRLRLEQVLDQCLRDPPTADEAVAVVMLDVDHFKAVNDTWGHPVGDQVLRTVAQLLQRSVRQSDHVGRWGGEEFLVVCLGTDLYGASCLAEELRHAVAEQAFPQGVGLTCSFGVAASRPGDDVDTLIDRADVALYRAKAEGRNRVEVEAG